MIKTLISDDMDYWHDIVERNLRFFGFNEFLHAYTIEECLERYKNNKPGLIITDINYDPLMPGNIHNGKGNLDGLRLCEQIREQDRDIKIVVMSSIEECAKETSIKNGADYFIQKKRFKEEIENFIKMHYGWLIEK
ncbi:MAG: response regulator [Nanoarchaeota archaeon]|nr:response regulator [Nanoarchaeota archaeon]